MVVIVGVPRCGSLAPSGSRGPWHLADDWGCSHRLWGWRGAWAGLRCNFLSPYDRPWGGRPLGLTVADGCRAVFERRDWLSGHMLVCKSWAGAPHPLDAMGDLDRLGVVALCRTTDRRVDDGRLWPDVLLPTQA